MMFADIVIDISAGTLDRTFSYRVPENLEEDVSVGMTVTVPFGMGNKSRRGYITGLSDRTDYDTDKIKEILSVEAGDETTESRLVRLALWIRETYGSSLIQAFRTVFPVREKKAHREKRWLVLSSDEESARKKLAELSEGRMKARARILEALLLDPDHMLDYTYAVKELGMTPSVLNYLSQEGIAAVESEEQYRLPVRPEEFPPEEPKALNQGQEEAVSSILSEWESENRPVLIHGVTGSGKTEIYMKLIEKVIENGQQVIVLIPEISLTYQTIRRFGSRFGGKVSILNSKLTPAERYDQFVRAKQGKISIMVGPRSAVFTPFTNLGMIIMDEEHEPAYKSESTPRYHARETAIERARMENAHVILGSATPSLEAYHRAQRGEYCLIRLPYRHEGRPLPSVKIVDMRDELKKGNRSILSRHLQEGMEERLEKNEQTMLFLNRRGYAGFVSCRSCGHVIKCPHCDVSLSQHLGGRLVCHYCGHQEIAPTSCPECGSPYIGGFKAGTEQVVQVIEKRFPGARVLRMDADTTRTKGSYEAILSSFASHEADILIGTQMIVKGHDFPAVTLVGVLAADLSLNISDYISAERTYQLLTQAVGRSGRGERPGSAVIQTYSPDHYSIQAASRQDYEAFFREEMAYRTLMSYPPAAHMLCVHASCRDEEQLTKGMYFASQFARRLATGTEISVIGPAPCAVSKVKDMYRQVLYMKGKSGEALLSLRNKLEQYIAINPGFRDIYIQYDYN